MSVTLAYRKGVGDGDKGLWGYDAVKFLTSVSVVVTKEICSDGPQ